MRLTPEYGQTPVPDEELGSLLPRARDLLGEPVSKAAVYDLEQAVQEEVTEQLLTAVLEGAVDVDTPLSDHFVRELHRQLYSDVWSWAGLLRTHELNIGVAPEQIAVQLRASLESIRYRWQHTRDWTPRQVGVAAHAETVRIHPFSDGNGRTTRLLADLVFVAAQDGDRLEQYDWELDKLGYIRLLREYDRHRDPRDLSDFIAVMPLGE